MRIAGDGLVLSKPLLLWVNELWMALFFLLVGLEIKHEVLAGELASLKQAALPAVAALGDMVVPALIYVALNHGDAVAIIDDLGAILVNAVVYTAQLKWPMLLAAGAGVALLFLLNRARVTRIGP